MGRPSATKLRFSDFQHMKVFGCRGWIGIASEGKFPAKATDGIFIGYEENVKSYTVWDMKKEKVYIRHSLQFEDTVFPFKT